VKAADSNKIPRFAFSPLELPAPGQHIGNPSLALLSRLTQ
jgi:hypothetical protein